MKWIRATNLSSFKFLMFLLCTDEEYDFMSVPISVFGYIYIYIYIYMRIIFNSGHFHPAPLVYGGTQWCSWLRHCATSRRVVGSIPDGAILSAAL
jgi:hypothetical protein